MEKKKSPMWTQGNKKASQTSLTEREAFRAKLAAAGLLVDPSELGIPPDLEPISDEELDQIGDLPPGARLSEEIVDEDRGNY